MAHVGKRIRAAREGIERTKLYDVDQAVTLVKERSKAKFDETVEIAMNLGVDPKHADQMVRGVVNLPHGTGRVLRVAVFASGSFSLEIGGPQIPPGERSGVPDRKWVERIVHLLRTHGINDLIEEATSDQMTRAGNAGGELLNWIAMLGVIGDQIPILLEPQPHGHAFGVWRWE